MANVTSLMCEGESSWCLHTREDTSLETHTSGHTHTRTCTDMHMDTHPRTNAVQSILYDHYSAELVAASFALLSRVFRQSRFEVSPREKNDCLVRFPVFFSGPVCG